MVLDIAMRTRESAVQLGPAIPMADAVPSIVRNAIEVVYLDTARALWLVDQSVQAFVGLV